MDSIPVDVSFVIPVYNGAATVREVVYRILHIFAEHSVEIVLVNDGSLDDSEMICRSLAERFPGQVVFVHLAKNFGEHHAVLAGLSQVQGQYVAVLDDDGQNPPEEILPMWQRLKDGSFDVVYGCYSEKQHHWFRNFGSWFNDLMATRMLRKPKDIYLSSFKIMNRFVVREILKYQGPYPYIDGLIFRTTRNIGQIAVRHQRRTSGTSGYTFRKLLRLWLNMFLGFSIAPLRLAVIGGLVTSVLSAFLMLGILVDKIWLNPNIPVGIPTVLALVTLFSGIQLTVLGCVGEYVGRIFLSQNGTPQYVIRDIMRVPRSGIPAQSSRPSAGAISGGDMVRV